MSYQEKIVEIMKKHSLPFPEDGEDADSAWEKIYGAFLYFEMKLDGST